MILECKHCLELHLRVFDDFVSPETRELVQRHLEHCEILFCDLDSTRNILVLTRMIESLNSRWASANVSTPSWQRR